MNRKPNFGQKEIRLFSGKKLPVTPNVLIFNNLNFFAFFGTRVANIESVRNSADENVNC